MNVEPRLRVGEPSLAVITFRGHVDGVGRVRVIALEGDGVRMVFDAPTEVLRYSVEKGSIAVEGVSLTITEVDNEGFVALVPHTLAETTLGALQPGEEVNLEADAG